MHKYGYAIVDRHDLPWFCDAGEDGGCVSDDEENMELQCDILNETEDEDERAPYRVVTLFYSPRRIFID